MKFRFRIRTLMLITLVAALFAYWVFMPLLEFRREQELVRQLTELTFPDRKNPIWAGLDTPSEYQNSIHQKLIDPKKLERVIYLSLSHGNITDDAISIVKKLKHLRHLEVNFTSLTNSQCESLASCPRLKVIDCAGTPVRFETLIRMKRKNPNFCHLAHRRALAEMRHVGADVANWHEKGLTVFMRRSSVDSKMCEAIRFIGRPIDTISLGTLHLNRQTLDQLRRARSDFQLELSIDKFSYRSAILDKSMFEVLTGPRIRNLHVSVMRFSDECHHHSESELKTIQLNNCSLRRLDDSIIPESLERLMIVSTTIEEIDLSHCKHLEYLWINDDWEIDRFRNVLALPQLEKIEWHGEQPLPAEVRELCEEHGVTLSDVGH